jgi:tetratricopeptide (TPR) repeat protein
MALNHMANYSFHTWKTISSKSKFANKINGTIREFIVPKAEGKDIGPFDLIRFNQIPNQVFTVESIRSGTSTVTNSNGTANPTVEVTVTADIDISNIDVSSDFIVETRELGRALKLATEAVNATTVSNIKAEGYYIMGKIYHIQNNIDNALVCYRRALEVSDMMLAAFGVAQIFFSRRELGAALDLFERVLSVHPDDKDTQAYVYLVRALHRSEITSFELLRDVAPGFQFEVDLWSVQGQLRLQGLCTSKDTESVSVDYGAALKCFMNAFDACQQKKIPPSSSLLSNIGVLYHCSGKLFQSLSYMRQALQTEQQMQASDKLVLNPSFKSTDLEGVFFEWSQSFSYVVATDTAMRKYRFVDSRNEGYVLEQNEIADGISYIRPGEDIVLNGFVCKVDSIDNHEQSFVVSSLYQLPVAIINHNSHPMNFLKIHHKILYSNFCDDTITLCYNFARVLEDNGRVKGAIEIFVELLKRHPSFTECKS